VADGFLKYPATLVDAITDKPGKGGAAIKAMVPVWGAVPPGLANNSYLQALGEELGVQIDFSTQDGNTYADKLGAIIGARDVPEMLTIPSWEVGKIPRFADAVAALFEDLTPFLGGEAVNAYKLLASLPTNAWQNAVWGGKLAALPWPTDGPFPWALFHRKDLADKAGVSDPKSLDELYEYGKKLTNPSKGVWAFGPIFDMVQMFHKLPGARGGWGVDSSGKVVHKYELPEYKKALEFTTKLFKEGLVHPDIVANSKSVDAGQLFNSGKLICRQDGIGAWKNSQAEQAKITPGYNMQPIAIFSAVGGDPLEWGSDEPIFYTFIKKGLGKDRVEELLRVANWGAAPLGTKEFEMREYGVEGKHFTRGADGTPTPNDLGRKENTFQMGFLVGRTPAIIQTPDSPHYVQDLLTYSNATVKYLEKDPWAGLKLEMPANYTKMITPMEDKVQDILRGRAAVSDWDAQVKTWRDGGGEEGRTFLTNALKEK
jgi:putative aldouronate transport system substrate-binding protein